VSGAGVRITFKLFATLGQYLPPQADGRAAEGNQVALDLPEDSTVQGVIDRFHLPPKLVHLVLVNGAYIPPAERGTCPLREGDALAVWPPVAGG